MDLLAYEDLTGYKLRDTRDNWKSLCPVHDESTPSFYIHKETYLCHCFGCGVKGMLDTVLAKALEMDIREIREQLDLPHLLSRPIRIEPTEYKFKRSLLAPFPRVSQHPHLKKRGFKSDTVMLAHTQWDEKRRRLVFPLRSLGGVVDGAAGRATRTQDSKWYFYGNTKTGHILYQPLDTLRLDIIVEGIFDCLWLFQHGYTGSAALMGSWATMPQINLIKRNTDEVLLFLDNDEPGRMGQEYLAKELKSTVKVTFAVYPKGKKDPQELTTDELHTAIQDRQTYVEYTHNRY